MIRDKENKAEYYCDPCFKKNDLSDYKKEMDDYHKRKKEEAFPEDAAKILFERFRHGKTPDDCVKAAQDMAIHFDDPWSKKSKGDVGKALLNILVPKQKSPKHSRVVDLTGGRPDTPEWIVFLCVADQRNAHYNEYLWELKRYKDRRSNVSWAAAILNKICPSLPSTSQNLCKETIRYIR